eukprot:scaffold35119_cov29-Phaeocystis_antarctica.AAC.1
MFEPRLGQLLHLVLDAGSNAAADGLGLSKLLDLLGGALMVTGIVRPQVLTAPLPGANPNPQHSPSPLTTHPSTLNLTFTP